MHLVGFIIKEMCHDARSHVTMHGHMNVKLEGKFFPVRNMKVYWGGLLNYGCSGVYFVHQNDVRSSVSRPGRFTFAQLIRYQLDRYLSGLQDLLERRCRKPRFKHFISIHIQTTFIIHFRARFLFLCFGIRWWARDISLLRLPRSHSDTPNSV